MKYLETLQQEAKAFLEAAEARKDKVGGKIKELSAAASRLQRGIDSKTARIVTFELDGNDKATEQLRAEIREERSRVEEINAEIKEYQKQLKGDPSALRKTAVKIQEAAQQAEERRKEEKRSKHAEVTELERQKEALDQRIKALNHEIIQSSEYYTINTIKSIVGMIDERFKQLDYSKQEACAKQWMNGGSIEAFFEAPLPSKGSAISYGEGHRYGHGPDDYIKTNNTPIVTFDH